MPLHGLVAHREHAYRVQSIHAAPVDRMLWPGLSCRGSPSCVPAGRAYGVPRGTGAPRLRLPVLSYDVRRTARADTMARRARHSSLLAFPAEAPLTPGTLDQEIALPQRDDLLAKLTILRPESEKLSGQCVYLPHDSSIRSWPTRPHTSTTLSTVPQAGGHAAGVVCGPQRARPVHTRPLDRLMLGKR